ncbi:MAG: methyl-accepting chemotaxis protein [Bryobacteraceae bacterium]
MNRNRRKRQGWTVGARLLAAFGSLILVTLAGGVASVQTIRWLNGEIGHALKIDLRQARQTGGIQALFATMDADQHALILFTMMGDAPHAASAVESFRKASADAGKTIASIISEPTDSNRRDTLAALDKGRVEWTQRFEQLTAACAAQRCNEALEWMFDRGFANTAAMNALAEKTGEQLQKAGDDAAARTSDEVSVRGSLLLGLALIAGLVGVFVLRSVRQVSTRLRALANAIAQGSEELAPVTDHMSSSSQKLAADASRGSASIDKLANLAESIAQGTREAAENAERVSELATATGQQMEQANHAVAQLTESMRSLVEASRRIASITKVIEEIAFRTNLLALNAAVEAARAGAAGAGFSVVAEEVRTLAQNSSQAARETAALTAALIDAAIKSCGLGEEKLGLVDGSIREITGSTGKVKSLASGVTLRTKDQSAAVQRIVLGLAEIREVTKATADTAQLIADGSGKLTDHVEGLEAQVVDLRSLVG